MNIRPHPPSYNAGKCINVAFNRVSLIPNRFRDAIHLFPVYPLAFNLNFADITLYLLKTLCFNVIEYLLSQQNFTSGVEYNAQFICISFGRIYLSLCYFVGFFGLLEDPCLSSSMWNPVITIWPKPWCIFNKNPQFRPLTKGILRLLDFSCVQQLLDAAQQWRPSTARFLLSVIS